MHLLQKWFADNDPWKTCNDEQNVIILYPNMDTKEIMNN